MATSKSGPLDAMVGARIQMFRLNRSMSQTMLAGRSGVTFQQVQQYERGANRAGASQLAQIASALSVSVGEFFESSRTESPRYARTTNPRLRLCIANLVEGIAAQTPRIEATVAHLHAVDRGQRWRFPREDSLPPEDERRSRAGPSTGVSGRINLSRESQSARAVG